MRMNAIRFCEQRNLSRANRYESSGPTIPNCRAAG
jgi:hypothetical protein